MKKINNPLNVTVSYCKNHKDQKPSEINLYEFLTDGRFKEQVIALRNATQEKQSTLKDSLPVCTVSGLFGSRKGDSLISASNLICIDIDEKDNTELTDFDSLKERISECPYVLFCAHSARGKGYFCIIQIADSGKFKEHFFSLEKDFKRAGITIDKSCKDINRLRYATYDSEPYINLNATIYSTIVDIKKQTVNNLMNKEFVPKSKIRNVYLLGLLTASLDKQGKDITENYSDWFNIACAIANEFGEDGRIMFHNLSKNYNGYDVSKTNNEYNKAIQYDYSGVSIEKVFNEYALKNDILQTNFEL